MIGAGRVEVEIERVVALDVLERRRLAVGFRNIRCSNLRWIAYARTMQRTVIAIAVLFTACMAESALGPSYHRTLAAPEATRCQDEQRTGSTITRRVCRSPEQREDEDRAKQSWMNNYPANPLRGDFTYPGLDARHPPDASE